MPSWQDLRVDYFERIGREVFDEYMKRRGFGRGEADDIGGLTYHRGNQFATIDYSVEDRPTYSPHVEIGFTRTRSRRLRSYARWLVGGSARPISLDRLPLWYAIPSDSQHRDYERWRYSSEAELRQALARLRDEVVEVYARPLWEDPQELHNWIAKFSVSSQINRAWCGETGSGRAEAPRDLQEGPVVNPP